MVSNVSMDFTQHTVHTRANTCPRFHMTLLFPERSVNADIYHARVFLLQ